MDGNYHNKETMYTNFLENWVKKGIHEKAWEKYDDLHIDEIDIELKDSNLWVQASLFIYTRLLKLIDTSKYDILLAIPLSYSHKKTEKSVLDITYISENLDSTPPSFYLFPIGNDDFKHTIQSATYLHKLSYQLKFTTYYKEEKEDDEYFRTIFITSDYKSD